MNNNYILRLKNSLLSFYYLEDKGIMVKKYENGKFSQPEVLFQDALPDFTLSIKNGEPNIFCRDKSGSIFLISRQNDVYSAQAILKNKSEQVHKILFHSLGQDKNMSLIYNIPETGKRYKLLKQSLSEDGVWDKPKDIDIFQGFKDKMFSIQTIGQNHHIIIYMDAGGTLGYREINPEKHSEFCPIAPLSDNILDYSILATNDAIHFLYITGNFFNLRLMYKKKTDDTFTKPIILWEGQRIDNCLLWINSDDLIASFMSGKSLYMQKSTNNGNTFYQPEIYKNKFCLNPIRASYISEMPMDKSDFFVREVYIDMYNPWDVQILPDISRNFLPDVIIPEPVPVEPEIKEPEPKPAENTTPDMIMERLNKIASENQDLRYRYAKAAEELNERTNIMERMKRSFEEDRQKYESEIVSLKNNLAVLEASWKALAAQKAHEAEIIKEENRAPLENVYAEVSVSEEPEEHEIYPAEALEETEDNEICPAETLEETEENNEDQNIEDTF